ncbi:hypothetical protein [Bradyrhizobium sp. UASWS1016]|jgi:hypothetical protein|uniref:hypothetical protein n=1 Tax=Bradyrhizobium sp. UASWS1016 TaxID=1566379 RepID=UPI000C272106|nr:hypothetical protein [Bradyrhizobium sp. UASWS1016]
MGYSWWDALKDLLGAVGSTCVAIPWLRDFWLRLRRDKIEGVVATGRLDRLRASIEASMRAKIDSPKMGDFIWTIVGLAMIFASFLIAFIRGLGDLLGYG